MKFKTVREMWEEFAAAVLPHDCSSVQRSEMQKAFYAGFCQCRQACTVVSNELPEDEAVAAMCQWDAELERFYEQLIVDAGLRN